MATRCNKTGRERITLVKKSTLRTRSVSGFVLLFLLLLTLFAERVSAVQREALLRIDGTTGPEEVWS